MSAADRDAAVVQRAPVEPAAPSVQATVQRRSRAGDGAALGAAAVASGIVEGGLPLQRRGGDEPGPTAVASGLVESPLQRRGAGGNMAVPSGIIGWRGPAALVQRRSPLSGHAVPGSAEVRGSAERGVATPATSLPHAAAVQRAFGHHDVSTVKAHTGGEAAASARAMGADGYATGDHVVLGERGTDLFTVAHEAAHVVQQRAGIQLPGGVGAAGDAHERHADEVAAQVVQGKSAQALLDRYTSPGAASASGGLAPVQRRVKVFASRDRGGELSGGQALTDVDAAWATLQGTEPRLASQPRAREILAGWIRAEPEYEDPGEVSEDRMYENYRTLARSLLGEARSEANLARETALAARVTSEGEISERVGAFIERLGAVVRQRERESDSLRAIHARPGRYHGWAYPWGTPLGFLFDRIPDDLTGRVGFVVDYALEVRTALQTHTEFRFPSSLDEARETHHNVNEDSSWVQRARTARAPLSAGASARTAHVLGLAVLVQAPQSEINALAWGMFAMWNVMPRHRTGTHRFHEVMAVAKHYGVPYADFRYPSAPPGADDGGGGQHA